MAAEWLQKLQHAFVVRAIFAGQSPGDGARPVVVPDEHGIRVSQGASPNVAARPGADAFDGLEELPQNG